MSESDFRIHKSPMAPGEAVDNATMQAYVQGALSSVTPASATTTDAGVVRLASEGSFYPGNEDAITAGFLIDCGIELHTPAVGGNYLGNVSGIYMNTGAGDTATLLSSNIGGVFLAHNMGSWVLSLGTGTPDDTIVDTYGVGSSNGMWRVGRHNGLGNAMRFDDGTYQMQLGAGLNNTFSEGFLFSGDSSFAFFGLDTGCLVAEKFGDGSLTIGSGYTHLTSQAGGILRLGHYSGSYVSVGAADGRVSFFAGTPVVKQTGTPADATDLATAITLINNLKAKLIAYGLIA